MSVTDKFSKAVTFIPGKTTWDAKEWAIRLLDRLAELSWGLSRATIPDRHCKFVGSDLVGSIQGSQSRSALLHRLHPQTDDIGLDDQIKLQRLRYGTTSLSLALLPTFCKVSTLGVAQYIKAQERERAKAVPSPEPMTIKDEPSQTPVPDSSRTAVAPSFRTSMTRSFSSLVAESMEVNVTEHMYDGPVRAFRETGLIVAYGSPTGKF